MTAGAISPLSLIALPVTANTKNAAITIEIAKVTANVWLGNSGTILEVVVVAAGASDITETVLM